MDDFFEFPTSPEPTGQKPNLTTLIMGECLEILQQHKDAGIFYDAIVTDPPYELQLFNMPWDSTGIAFSKALWGLFMDVLKPGGFVMAFAAPRLYHKVAIAADNAGFTMYPFLTWQYPQGLPKPVNVSTLFDRDNIKDRQPVAWSNGSGYTTAKVKHGMQNLSKNKFPIYAKNESAEAKKWSGWYYGLNCFLPVSEPIILAQKPIATKRVIDNIREYGTGALNLAAVKDRHKNQWASTVLEYKKARKSDHQSDHPSVKPVDLMEHLCLLGCPPGGVILDPFAGTGTTGVAASRLGFSNVLIERNPDMQAVIERRLNSR